MVINQPTGILRLIETPEIETTWMLIPHSDPAVDEAFVFLGGNLAVVKAGDGTVERFEDWELDLNTISVSFPGIDGTLDGNVYGTSQAPRR